MSLSPWDLSGNISFDFSLYRPRRPSYVYATQTARRRNESYRHATKSDSNSGGDPTIDDFIEGIVRKKRKDSYKLATEEEIELGVVVAEINHVGPGGDCTRGMCEKEALNRTTCNPIHSTTGTPANTPADTPSHGPIRGHQGKAYEAGAEESGFRARKTLPRQNSVEVRKSKWRYRKNLIVLSLSFILVFTAFRSIQNLQSSINNEGRLGMIAMACVHGTMFLTCLFAPVLINKLTSKWTIVLGLLFYLFWIAANFYPHFYTLIPTSIGVGFGQSLAWGAQVTYIQKLAVDYAYLSKELTHQELSKFNGIFLACFQTTHIWGNVVSSLMLASMPTPRDLMDQEMLMSEVVQDPDAEYQGPPPISFYCGVYDLCQESVPYVHNISNTALTSASNTVLKLMGAYLVFAFVGFIIILLFLEKIGAKSDPEKPCLQMVWNNVRQIVNHKTYRLLIPLLIFNGFEQGFVYADYNKSYISCTIGVEYVGYNMITLGTANSVFSVLVGMVARHVPREAIIGVGSILHIGLMVFLLVWIPDTRTFPVFFVVSALWGVCDAIWQTQCNSLVNLSCPDEHDVAFQNFRMLQGLGASLAFGLGAFVCVAFKLYVIISLMVLAILCYAIAEYRIRRELLGSQFDSS